MKIVGLSGNCGTNLKTVRQTESNTELNKQTGDTEIFIEGEIQGYNGTLMPLKM